MSFLIRVQLPDRPGALGAVATALGEVGVDILSLDVVERRSGIAIDDLVVELPSGRLPDVLITAAESVEGVEVDAVRPWAGVLDTHRELELVEEIAATPANGLQVFTDKLPNIIRAGWAIVLTTTEGRPHRVAVSFAAPETRAVHLPWWPLRRATILDGEDDWVPLPWRELGTELAATPLGGTERVLLIGRPGGPMFRAAEVARLEHLAGIVAVVLRNSGDSRQGRAKNQ
ncbi:MAG: ACT domain-containing protein [Pseudonocardiaceae bacterium]